MKPENVEEFLKWFDDELSKLHLTDYQFAKMAGLTHTTLSKARKGKLPGWGACLKIADALHVDPVFVFRLVGLLPKRPEIKPAREQLIFVCENLPEDWVPAATRVLQALPPAE
jgi:transcriptional regulator with XRE-family HTH domain